VTDGRQFRIDRNLAVPLAEQVAEGLRKGIASGLYRVGDTLPSFNALSAAHGVSQRVTREAVRMLAAEGLVVVRPRSGCRVAGAGANARRGRILAVFHDYHRYAWYAMAMLSEVERLSTRAGYAFETVYVPLASNGVCDMTPLEDALRSPFSLVFSQHVVGKVERFLAGCGVPYVAIGASYCIPGAAMALSARSDDADADCVDRCVALGVRKALVVDYGRTASGSAVAKRFLSAGVEVEWRQIPLRLGFGCQQFVERDGYEFALGRFSPGMPRPDVAVVMDDYFLRGFLLGLERRRVSVPEDVRLVGLVNKGFAPASPVPLASLVVDARRGAKDVFAALRSVLDGTNAQRGYYGLMHFEDGLSLGGGIR